MSDKDCNDPAELVAEMEKWIDKGYLVFVKWTCPKCGERVTTGEPNVFHAGGYYHDAPGCGALYQGQRYGFSAVAVTGDKSQMDDLLKKSYESMPGYEGPLPGLNAERN